MHFGHFPFIRACWWGVYYHRGGWPPILYIYSLGHFLTTKGALIDGDGYPPKNPKNDPKMTPKNSEIWSKLETKMCQKTRFLMAKSTFSVKFTQLTWKTVKNDQKLTPFYTPKMRSNLTIKRGDSGSALMLGEKCVITEAPNLVTKNDTKWSRAIKSDKKWQKTRKQKNRKIMKMQKVIKSTKCKSVKIRKVENQKHQK